MFGHKARHSVAEPTVAPTAPLAPETDEQRLVRQCDAFLHGTLLWEHTLHGETPEPWEYVNLLAHADHERLHHIADGYVLAPVGGIPANEHWRLATAYLAGLVLDISDHNPLGIQWLQRRVLIPLELEMAEDRSGASSSPEYAVRTVLFRLDRSVAGGFG